MSEVFYLIEHFSMKRRDLFTSAAIATSVIALNNSFAKASSLPKIRWQMATSWTNGEHKFLNSLDILSD